jgi:hypothetical protein
VRLLVETNMLFHFEKVSLSVGNASQIEALGKMSTCVH